MRTERRFYRRQFVCRHSRQKYGNKCVRNGITPHRIVRVELLQFSGIDSHVNIRKFISIKLRLRKVERAFGCESAPNPPTLTKVHATVE